MKDHVSPQNCLHTSTILAGKAGCIIALHFVLPTAVLTLVFLGNSTVSFRGWKCATCVVGAKAAVHHFAWLDATGRLFGLCEVLLSYIDGRELVLTLQFSKLAGGL